MNHHNHHEQFSLTQKIDKIIENRTYYTEYQPIIDVRKNTVYAYEALARFQYGNELLPPDVVFKALHTDLAKLSRVEYEIKMIQLENSPDNHKVFINYDPHSAVYNGMDELYKCSDLYFGRRDVVFELTEDIHVLLPGPLENLLRFLKQADIEIAVDDFGKRKSFFSFGLIDFAHYIKIDMEWVPLAKSHKHWYDFLYAFIVFVHSSGKTVVLEGVETQKDLELAEKLDADLVQGFLFRNKFII